MWRILQMPKRPRSHVLGDIAVSKLIDVFTSVGWTAEIIRQDYGEDLLVRIFEGGEATEQYFFVQSKAVESVSRYEKEYGYIRYSFKPKYVEMWRNIRHPVIVTLYDAGRDIIYWQDIQQYNEDNYLKTRGINTFMFHADKSINKEGIQEFKRHIDERYDDFWEGSVAPIHIMNALAETYGLEIDLRATGLIMLPRGKFVPANDKGMDIIFYGKIAHRYQEVAKTSVSQQELFQEAIDRALNERERLKRGEKIIILDENGVKIDEFSSVEEMMEKRATRKF